MSAPSISVVVPVNNEATILTEQVTAMVSQLSTLPNEFELLLVENGSIDATEAQCQSLSSRFDVVRSIALPIGDYGMALREGIRQARHEIVVIFNVEFWSLEFVTIALTALRTRDLVIGSKSAPGATDDRPRIRRVITKSYNRTLRFLWGFSGTDTHGMKAFHRIALLPFVESCVCTGFVFDTELVLRAERAGLKRLELPTDVKELRAPSSLSLIRRIPHVLTNLLRLWREMRLP
jgi:glycosyltransferase involved in cell wall biosynthesis